MPRRRSAGDCTNDAQSRKWRVTPVRRTKPMSARKPSPTFMIEYCARSRLSSQPSDALEAVWPRASFGVSDLAAKPLRLRLPRTRKLASAPTTRLKSPASPEAWRDITIAPTSEEPNRSRRTRATE